MKSRTIYDEMCEFKLLHRQIFLERVGLEIN